MPAKIYLSGTFHLTIGSSAGIINTVLYSTMALRAIQEMHRSWNLTNQGFVTWPYPINFISTNMVRTRVRGNLRMRKQNTKTTVPLDVAPERRTKRCSPRFRPGGRFCELRFRYLSSPTGREGEISRPLDHMRQIPFIHSTRPINSNNFYIYRTVFYIFSPCGTLRCVLM